MDLNRFTSKSITEDLSLWIGKTTKSEIDRTQNRKTLEYKTQKPAKTFTFNTALELEKFVHRTSKPRKI